MRPPIPPGFGFSESCRCNTAWNASHQWRNLCSSEEKESFSYTASDRAVCWPVVLWNKWAGNIQQILWMLWHLEEIAREKSIAGEAALQSAARWNVIDVLNNYSWFAIDLDYPCVRVHVSLMCYLCDLLNSHCQRWALLSPRARLTRKYVTPKMQMYTSWD